MSSADAWSALLGAGVGGLATLGAVVVTGFTAMRLERQHQQDSRRADLVTLLRNRTAEVFRLVFAVEHELYTLCWFAQHFPGEVTQTRVDRYDRTVQGLLPTINGVLAEIAGINPELYRRLRAWTEQLDQLEGRIALMLYGPRTASDIARIAESAADVRTFFNRLPDEMGSVLLDIEGII